LQELLTGGFRMAKASTQRRKRRGFHGHRITSSVIPNYLLPIHAQIGWKCDHADRRFLGGIEYNPQ
jgi:hypothetical protein